VSPTPLMADAWKRYHRMRLGIYLPGDALRRRFIQSIFAKALRAAWQEANANAQHAEIMHHREAEAVAGLAARNLVLTAAAGALSSAERLRRIRAVREELRLLPYRPLSVDIGDRGSLLTAELTALEASSQTERKAA
jgi:hypothetical protein